MNIHLTFAMTALTIVLLVVAKELIHPVVAVLLGMGGVLFSARKLKLLGD